MIVTFMEHLLFILIHGIFLVVILENMQIMQTYDYVMYAGEIITKLLPTWFISGKV